MGEQIIRQPDGLYAIFSSVTDSIHFWDATEDEIVEEYAARAATDTRKRVREKIAHVAAGNPRAAYHQFAMTWEEALAKDRENGGDAHKEFKGLPMDDQHASQDPEGLGSASDLVDVYVLLTEGDQAVVRIPGRGQDVTMSAADIAAGADLPENELPGRDFTARLSEDERGQISLGEFQLINDPRI